MLHINFNTKRIDDSTLIGLGDTIIITGAPDQLAENIKIAARTHGLSLNSTASCSNSTCKCGRTVKVPLGYAGPPATKQAIQHKSEELSNHITETASSLRNGLASLFLGNARFVSDMRVALQNDQDGKNACNPGGYTVTTLNTKIALALYSMYDSTSTFSSLEGSKAIRKHVSANQDNIAYLCSDLNILTKVGAGVATRYHFSKKFEAMILTVLSDERYLEFSTELDNLQDQIDNL